MKASAGWTAAGQRGKRAAARKLKALLLGLIFALCLGGAGNRPVQAQTQNAAADEDCPAEIQYGDILQCSIGAAGEHDSYTLNGSIGDVVLIRMGHASGNLYPRLQLTNSHGSLVCSADGLSVAEISGCTLAENGVFTLTATDTPNVSTGAYTLAIQRMNGAVNATAVSFGQNLTGAVSSAAWMGSYTVAANSGDHVLVRMSHGSGDLYPEVRLYAPNGTRLCRDFKLITAELSDCVLTADGTYTILAVDHTGGLTGDFGLSLQRLNAPGSAVPITFGQTLSGAITTPAQMDTYSFTGLSGDKVLVRMGHRSDELSPEVRLFGPNGALLCSDDSLTMAELDGCVLPADGSYTLLTMDHPGELTGTYGVYVQRFTNPGSTLPLAYQQIVVGTVSKPAEMRAYAFSGSAGDPIEISMENETGNLSPEIRLYAPDGSLLASKNNLIRAVSDVTLPSTGEYLLLAGDHLGVYSGDYTLSLKRTDIPDHYSIYIPLVIR